MAADGMPIPGIPIPSMLIPAMPASETAVSQRTAQTAAGAHDRAISSISTIPNRRRMICSD